MRGLTGTDQAGAHFAQAERAGDEQRRGERSGRGGGERAHRTSQHAGHHTHAITHLHCVVCVVSPVGGRFLAQPARRPAIVLVSYLGGPHSSCCAHVLQGPAAVDQGAETKSDKPTKLTYNDFPSKQKVTDEEVIPRLHPKLQKLDLG